MLNEYARERVSKELDEQVTESVKRRAMVYSDSPTLPGCAHKETCLAPRGKQSLHLYSYRVVAFSYIFIT